MKKIFNKLTEKLKNLKSSKSYFQDSKQSYKKLDSQKYLEFFTDPKNREKINLYFYLFVFIGTSYLSAKILASFLAPNLSNDSELLSVKPVQTPKISYNDSESLSSKQVFKTPEVSTGNKQEKQTRCLVAKSKSNLPIKLYNTVVLQDQIKSVASVQVRSRSELKSIKVGDKIESLAKVEKIKRLEIIIKNLKTGQCEFVENKSKISVGNNIRLMSPNKAKDFIQEKNDIQGIVNSGNDFTICKGLLNSKLKDIGSIIRQAKAIQMSNPDGSISFKIINIEPGSIYSFLGIEDDDIITTINGKKITALNEIMNMFSQISNVQNLNIGIDRDGTKIPRQYKITTCKNGN